MQYDNDLFIIKQECKYCLKEHIHAVPDKCCHPCFFEHNLKDIISKKPDNKWKKIKRTTYCVLLTMPPLYYVGCKYGIRFEYISLLFFVGGIFINHIVDCLDSIF
jgi:hypothetical protein